jgi:tripartite-type tricarboxylate transporter receptor subunit TctC
MGEMFKNISGADVVHIPYKGLGPALTDVLGGHVIFTFPSISTVQGFVKGGKAKVLAISGEARSPLMPDVPTFTEVGFKDMDMGAWYAFLAPAGTPREAIDRINKAVADILADPEVLKDFTGKGMQAAPQTTEQFSNFIRTETERMTRMVKSSGIKVE